MTQIIGHMRVPSRCPIDGTYLCNIYRNRKALLPCFAIQGHEFYIEAGVSRCKDKRLEFPEECLERELHEELGFVIVIS